MQKIFYNAKIITNNENNDECSAMLVNDGSIVFVGGKQEVLNLKSEETKIIDLGGGFVYPSLFGLGFNVFKIIDEKIKNAKKGKNFQISADINENYDNFANFEEYKKEYIKTEKKLIAQGVTTISEIDIDRKEFAFWKKMSEEKLLKLDIVAYVNFFDSKQVMDDNCVTYRKYKNHFRLGGYYLKVDGKIQELKAWFNKPYTGTKSHYGSGEIYGEQLYFLLKMALEEKKQIIFEVDGDKSMQEVLTVFEELEVKEKIDNFYRPVFYCSGFIPKSLYSKLKHFDVTLLFKHFDLSEYKTIKKFLGFRRRKYFYNLNALLKNDIRFILLSDGNIDSFLNDLINMHKKQKCNFSLKMLKFNKSCLNFTTLMLKLIYSNPAYICFDTETKAGLDNQKQASFFVSDNDILKQGNEDLKIKMVEIFEE